MGEKEHFEKSEFCKLKKSDKRLLWHGSRTTNYGGILSQGLRIAPPEAPLNGYAFGKGVYLADVSSKSAQYCAPGMSGGIGLLLLIEAELGKPKYEIPTGDPNAQEQMEKHGCYSTLGVGKTAPQGWIDGECIHKSLEGVSVVSLADILRCLLDDPRVTLSCSRTFQRAWGRTRLQMPTGIYNSMSKAESRKSPFISKSWRSDRVIDISATTLLKCSSNTSSVLECNRRGSYIKPCMFIRSEDPENNRQRDVQIGSNCLRNDVS